MAFNTEALGRRIGEIRRRRGLSQMALAEQIEKAPTFISSIETHAPGAVGLTVFFSAATVLYGALLLYCGTKLRKLRKKYGEQ